jgi:hypothetical protein
MAKRKIVKKSPSPYQKYGKSPYLYTFGRCAHKTQLKQSVPGWSGMVCSVCNIITKPDKKGFQATNEFAFMASES